MVLLDGLIDLLGIELLQQDDADGVDNAAHEDGESADMEKGHAGEPAIIGMVFEGQGGADGIPPLHAIGDDHTFRGAGGAGGVHDGLCVGEIDGGTKISGGCWCILERDGFMFSIEKECCTV